MYSRFYCSEKYLNKYKSNSNPLRQLNVKVEDMKKLEKTPFQNSYILNYTSPHSIYAFLWWRKHFKDRICHSRNILWQKSRKVSANYAAGDSVILSKTLGPTERKTIFGLPVERILMYQLQTFIEFKTSLTRNYNELAESHFLDTYDTR